MADITKHDHESEHPERNPNVAFDRQEENVKAVSGFGIGLAIGVILVVFAMWGMFEWFYAREDRANPEITPVVRTAKPQVPPEPRLQAQPKLDLKALRESEDKVLGEATWVDPDHGIARIPIEDAIRIVAAKGLPSRPTEGAGYREIPSKASSARTTEKISQ